MIYSDLAEYILLIFVAAGCVYSLMATISVALFFRKRKDLAGPQISSAVPVSILKPLKGHDAELGHNILSFCEQDYKESEVLLGINRPGVNEIAEIQAMSESLYENNVRVITSYTEIGVNRKVSNMHALFEASKNQLIVLSDSDMRVDRTYLNTIVAEYQSEENVGMVTCLYKITKPKSAGAAFESLSIALDFLPSVLVARWLEGISFGLGASMLLSRKGLEEIGGFKEVADYIADDYQIGNRLSKLGYRILISRYVVEDVAGPMTFAEYFGHQLRWARTIKVSRPAGFAGSGITHILPFAFMLSVLWGFSGISLALLAAVFMLRLATAVVVYKSVIKSPGWLKWILLLPFKDILSFIIWIVGLFGSKVQWRGEKFRIYRSGKITKI
jgi:ceramide glucosyltransferase